MQHQRRRTRYKRSRPPPNEPMSDRPHTFDHRHRRCDVVVVGAGPAGAAAAITVANAGAEVVVIDRAVFPRTKCCGDGLTTGALRLLDRLGLDPSLVPSWRSVRTVHIAGPKGTSIRFELPDGPGTFAAIARRTELDHALVQRARGAGAQVLEGVALTDLSVTATSVRAHTTAGVIEARHFVAADGMWSPTRKLLGLGSEGYRGEWHAFRQYFTGASAPAQEELFVWFEQDLLPGYVWSFPLADGTVNVGFGIQRDRGIPVQAMKQLWSDVLSRPRIAAVLGDAARAEGRHLAWPIPARLGELPVGHGRILFVGDAVAATDPMTGEGIGQALETAIGAGEAILKHGPEPDRILHAYDRRLRRTMQRDHRLARALSNTLASPALAQASIRAAGLTGWTRRNFVRWLFEDYPRAVLATPGRWHPRVFNQPGAFTGGGAPTDR